MHLSDTAQALLRMGQLAVIRREPALVTRTGTGWLHRYRGGALVSPLPRGVPWNVAAANTRDIFCHAYHPAPGDVIVELGAEYGTETVTLSRAVGETGRVIAVEAHPRTCALLRATVAANALRNVEVVHAAVVGIEGADEPVHIADGPTTVSNSILDPAATIEVPALTVDALLDRYHATRVDLLKMNIEGAERPALTGMAATIDRVRNAVISCHDFKADAGAGEHFRTGPAVDAALTTWGFTTTRRPDDPRPWIRHYRYATR